MIIIALEEDGSQGRWGLGLGLGLGLGQHGFWLNGNMAPTSDETSPHVRLLSAICYRSRAAVAGHCLRAVRRDIMLVKFLVT